MGLRAGQWVEVKSAEEIYATLDEHGCLDNLPFMPEMLQYCGHRFQVYKSAHKTCDTIATYTRRGMRRTVHLAGLRCDGQGHDGCQASCLIFWKEAWLRRVPGLHDRVPPPKRDSQAAVSRCDPEILVRATRVAPTNGGSPTYRCQATELLRASSPMSWWDPRPYLRDLWSRNIRLRDFVRYVAIAVYNTIMRMHWRGRPYPYLRGRVVGKTPGESLDLQVGELVRVRSKDEIMSTLDDDLKNRGLKFDAEMVPYCGRTFRVLRRVDMIVDEKTGRMIRLPNPCIILEGAICSGCLSNRRLFCPRAVYPYWREIWLQRVESRRPTPVPPVAEEAPAGTLA